MRPFHGLLPFLVITLVSPLEGQAPAADSARRATATWGARPMPRELAVQTSRIRWSEQADSSRGPFSCHALANMPPSGLALGPA